MTGSYWLMILPALALSMWASFKTRSAFKKYSKVAASSGMTGAQAAQRLLASAGISDVEVTRSRGMLSDHYNPATKKLALSDAVYGTPSIAAVGVACHEAGHAIQHATKYAALGLRTALVPTASIGSRMGMIVLIGGVLLGMSGLIWAGVILFSAVVLFQLVTLPVEFDASARAKKLAVANGIVLEQEREGMDKVLNAAALTYVAAVVSTLLTLLYFLLRAGLLGGRD